MASTNLRGDGSQLTDVQAPPADRRSPELRALCHDCRSPLTVIAAYASLAREDLPRESFAEAIDMLAIIPERVAEVEDLLDDYAFLESSGRDDEALLEPTVLDELMSEVHQEAVGRPAARSRDLDLKAEPDLPAFLCDRTGLARAVKSVAGHLRRAAHGEGNVELHASLDEPAGAVRLTVRRDSSAPDFEPGEARPPADERHYNFRLRFASRMAARSGGALHVAQGDERRAISFLLRPAERSAPGQTTSPAPGADRNNPVAAHATGSKGDNDADGGS